MRYTILLGIFISIFLSACASEKATNPKQFIVNGEIKGLNTHLYYRHPDKEYSRGTPLDSIIVKDGKFQWIDSVSTISMVRASTNFRDENNKLFKRPDGGGYFPVKSMYLMFLIEPGANVEISGEATDFMNAYPSGGEHNNTLAAINKLTFPVFNEVGNLMVDHSFEKDSIKAKAIEAQANVIDSLGKIERTEYLRANPNSIAALWYLDDMMKRRQIEDEVAIDIFNSVSKDFSDSDFYKTVASRVSGIMDTKEGSPVPTIKTMATLDGQEFDISTYRGKYILIDFWGIWCGPCVKEMPTVKAFQEKHKDKLVILGINSGDRKEKIEKFIAKHDYNWQHILSDRKNTPDNFVTRFNVKGFPTKFIIDPEGKILKRYVGGGETAFEFLEELL